MLPILELSLAAYTLGVVGITAGIARVGYIRRSDCPEAETVDRLVAKNEDLIAENLQKLQMLERRDADIEDADKTIAELAETVEKQARVLAAIAVQQTSGANATVRRMASLARKVAA